MDADCEVEIGGGAPVIEALWPGFVDLRSGPECIGQIQEATDFPPLAALLLALNGEASPLWTSKCDRWEQEPAELAAGARCGLACYVDLLPVQTAVFLTWQQAEAFCLQWVARLGPVSAPQCRVEFVVRQAVAGETEGFGVTAYLAASGRDRSDAAQALATFMTAFADAIPAAVPPATAVSKLQ
jgi:hypothetical protein